MDIELNSDTLVQDMVRLGYLTAEELVAMGYRRVSNKHCLVARVDRPDWLCALASTHPSWTINGFKKNDQGNEYPMWPDHYRHTHLCRDVLTVPTTMIKQIPSSGWNGCGYVAYDTPPEMKETYEFLHEVCEAMYRPTRSLARSQYGASIELPDTTRVTLQADYIDDMRVLSITYTEPTYNQEFMSWLIKLNDYMTRLPFVCLRVYMNATMNSEEVLYDLGFKLISDNSAGLDGRELTIRQSENTWFI